MKILWIVNMIFPYPAKQLGRPQPVFGGWLLGLLDKLKENNDIEIAIATVYNGKEIKEYEHENVKYYLLPSKNTIKYDKQTEDYWKEINNKFKPDIVHIHGTEFPHGLAFKTACPKVKTITSIQGLISVYARVYYANISTKQILKNITIRDILKRDNLFSQKKKFEQRGKNEIQLIKKSDAIIGRTIWDYANVKAINPSAKYYIGNETLRNKFYEAKWNINNIDKHSIFVTQGTYPIKGLHFALEAISILKYKYQNVKLYIAGSDFINRGILTSGYGKYIKSLIKKYNIEENIKFVGLLNEKEMIERLLKTHVFILPSAIENSSNSLGEAMLLGMPCVASNTGGTMDILEHKKEGFIYPYTEPAILAEYISRFFEDDSLCIEYGKNASNKAMIRHDGENNKNELIETYKTIYSNKS